MSHCLPSPQKLISKFQNPMTTVENHNLIFVWNLSILNMYYVNCSHNDKLRITKVLWQDQPSFQLTILPLIGLTIKSWKLYIKININSMLHHYHTVVLSISLDSFTQIVHSWGMESLMWCNQQWSLRCPTVPFAPKADKQMIFWIYTMFQQIFNIKRYLII